MCTVTYIPKGDNQFILTSNRDENQSRTTSLLESRLVGAEQVLFPVDPISGGSWIAISQSNRLAGILNGAFEKHHHDPPYKRSRGLILLDYFKTPGISHFIKRHDLEGIEPFTMVMYEQDLLVELRWDGVLKHTKNISLNTPHIWSSCTLYDQPARTKRADWFEKWWQETKDPDANDLLQFHRYGGEQDPSDGFVMNRGNKVKTLSITGIEKNRSSAILHHHDLIKNTTIQRLIDFSKDEIMESC